MHFPHGIDLGRRRSRPSSAGSHDVPASPYLQGEHLKRVRTRESTDADAWLPVLEEHQTLPAAAVESKGPLLGPPLSRVHTRLDSSCLWDDPKQSTQAALRSSAQLTDDEPLYEDEFVELFANRLVVRHLLCRNTVAFDLSEIRRARPFCTAARLVQLEAEELLDGKTGRPAGISNGGLGATGIIWARDKLRIRAGRWKEHAVVIDTGGVLGRVGFTSVSRSSGRKNGGGRSVPFGDLHRQVTRLQRAAISRNVDFNLWCTTLARAAVVRAEL